MLSKACEVEEDVYYKKGNMILKILQLARNDFAFNNAAAADEEANTWWTYFFPEDPKKKAAIANMQSALQQDDVSFMMIPAFSSLVM